MRELDRHSAPRVNPFLSPRLLPRSDLQAGWVADEFVQSADDLREARTGGSISLPAVQHQLVQGGRAVRRSGQPVVLLDGVYDLREAEDTLVTGHPLPITLRPQVPGLTS